MAEDHSAMVEKSHSWKESTQDVREHPCACVRACVWEKDCCAPEKLLMG